MLVAKFKPYLALTKRAISTTPSLHDSRSLTKMKKIQADMQTDDGKPVFLKGGVLDRVLYSATIMGCLVGVAMVLAFLYDKAKPPSWRTKTC